MTLVVPAGSLSHPCVVGEKGLRRQGPQTTITPAAAIPSCTQCPHDIPQVIPEDLMQLIEAVVVALLVAMLRSQLRVSEVTGIPAIQPDDNFFLELEGNLPGLPAELRLLPDPPSD